MGTGLAAQPVNPAMGAYFIRRKSRNELYRKVLATYVRHATEAGVTQAMFPEGGLSLTGGLTPPKLGLLKYMIDGFDLGAKDVMFVPVALNYDRVLEDKILISAGQAKERRFDARIGVIAGRTLKQFWLRLTGRFHRFGYAAVSFGRPVSLAEFAHAHSGDITVPLSKELMRRIGDIVPVLPVPLVASIMLEHGALTRTALLARMEELIREIPHAHIHMPRHDREYAVEVGLRQLLERGILHRAGETYAPNDAHRALLEYYANSIAHLTSPGETPGNRVDSAPAE